jgi:alpha-methylacyl-CoA racemase
MSLPLEGVRVLDLSRLLPGGFASLLLADFGAEVLKVEDTGMGDYIRWAPPYYDGAEDSAKSALFLALNRNKRSIRIDLKSEAGREVLLRLVHDYDVVLESFRPGVLDRLGVGYERMREVNPGIVYCAISGYGQDGPKRESAGHDMNYLALMGLLGLTGERDGPPVQAAGQIADLGGGALMAAFGILAALRERDGGKYRPGSGAGQIVDVSMADGALSWLAMVAGRYFAEEAAGGSAADAPQEAAGEGVAGGNDEAAGGNEEATGGHAPHRGDLELAGSLICYRPYECADGWVALGALEPKFWQAWCRGVEREELIEKQFEGPGSPAHREVQLLFKQRTRDEWVRFASEHDCCLEPVLDLDEALESPLVHAREMVIEIDQPGVAGGVRQLGIPIKLTRTPGQHAQRPGPALGEHTAEVLREAGYSPEEAGELTKAGAVAGPVSAGSAAAHAGGSAGFRA